MFSPIGLPLFFNRLSIRLTQDQKGLSKACNGDECKGVSIVLQHHGLKRTFLALLDSPFPFSPYPNLGFCWLFAKPQIKRIIGSRSSKV
ncbi:hypothetical protein H5410_023499 [Solanum commersonii]|uniref:Uncharacterized protein n=1 Tax=Solanum commersonii TaxID=4109 RepID=A0A9J5ZHR1_SOLCO|nr:hypothetical protein H5410_023499 [Solanum commersonii]